jgi:hypothetical protein
MSPRRFLVAGAAIATALCAAPTALAQAPTGTLALHEPASGGTFNFVDNAPKSHRAGSHTRLSSKDAVVFTNPLQDASHKRVGTLRVVCFVTRPGTIGSARLDCLGTFGLGGGNDIFVSAPHITLNGSTTDGTIVGGSGIYAGAKGTFHSVSHRNNTSDDTLTFTP